MVNGLVIVTTGTASGAVKLAGDGVGDVGQLLLLLLEVLGFGGGSVLLEPLVGLLDGVQDLLKMLAVCSEHVIEDSPLCQVLQQEARCRRH